MKTRIYIDGYNLYYGCLKKTPYKWLDLKTLFTKHILPSVHHTGVPQLAPSSAIKFFTANIIAKAALDPHSIKDQATYHNALQKYLSDDLCLYEGYYSINKVDAFQFEAGKLPKDSKRVEIWKLEEKQSDVNLATEALFDAVTEKELEQIVYVTNDTDIAASMVKVRQYNKIRVNKAWPPVRIGLVIPTKPPSTLIDKESRRANKTLSNLADWTVNHIRYEWLAQSQLPYKIITGRRPSTIPIAWHPEATLFLLIMEELKKVHNLSESWQWLESTKPEETMAQGLIDLTLIKPIDALYSSDGAAGVYEHAKAYVKWKQLSGQ